MSQLKALTELNIKLPKSAKPVGAYSAYKKIGKLIFISGQLPFKNDGTLIKGKVGKDMEIQQAKDEAELNRSKRLLDQIPVRHNVL